MPRLRTALRRLPRRECSAVERPRLEPVERGGGGGGSGTVPRRLKDGAMRLREASPSATPFIDAPAGLAVLAVRPAGPRALRSHPHAIGSHAHNVCNTPPPAPTHTSRDVGHGNSEFGRCDARGRSLARPKGPKRSGVEPPRCPSRARRHTAFVAISVHSVFNVQRPKGGQGGRVMRSAEGAVRNTRTIPRTVCLDSATPLTPNPPKRDSPWLRRPTPLALLWLVERSPSENAASCANCRPPNPHPPARSG